MKKLINEIKKMKKTDIGKQIDERLKIFESYKNKPNEEWFSELCFCILTANSKMMTAKAIQDELGIEGFMKKGEDEIRDCIKRNKHRFHNNKAKFIVEARKFLKIKDLLTEIGKEEESNEDVADSEMRAREWLVHNIKGLGYKEASHFLRNTGSKNLAIVDRHIQNILVEHNMLNEKPKTITKKIYLDVEKKLGFLGEKLNMPQAELDMYLFNIKTGRVYK